MKKHIFLIAGEPSGDTLGAALMRALKQQYNDQIVFTGIGGPQMEAEGMKSIVPMESICVMGLGEIVKHIPRLLGLIRHVVDHVEKQQPDMLVTIDLPDFNFRVCKKLKRRKIFKGKMVHYVAPTVWAWRPKRAEKIARFLDGLICLFPFEPDYFQRYGLGARFCGHPLVEHQSIVLGETSNKSPVLGLLMGSRHGELERHGKLFVDTVKDVSKSIPDLRILALTLPHLKKDVEELTQDLDNIEVTTANKWMAFARMDAALAVSGTIGLELAYAGVPHAIAYRLSPLSYQIARHVIKTPFAHLANIILKRPVVPELLQDDANVFNLAYEVTALLKEPNASHTQHKAFKGLRQSLSADGVPPSQAAARYISEIL